MAHPGGRPTKYLPEYCKRIIDFFNIKPVDITENIDDNGKLHIVCKPAEYPTFEKFAFDIGVTPAVMLDWCKVHQEFLEAYARAKALQKNILFQNALNGAYDSQFSKFVAVNCHGMKDRSEIVDVSKVKETVNKFVKAVLGLAVEYIPKGKQPEFVNKASSLLNELEES